MYEGTLRTVAEYARTAAELIRSVGFIHEDFAIMDHFDVRYKGFCSWGAWNFARCGIPDFQDDSWMDTAFVYYYVQEAGIILSPFGDSSNRFGPAVAAFNDSHSREDVLAVLEAAAQKMDADITAACRVPVAV